MAKGYLFRPSRGSAYPRPKGCWAGHPHIIILLETNHSEITNPNSEIHLFVTHNSKSVIPPRLPQTLP